jgi:acyl-CoA thioesterase-1
MSWFLFLFGSGWAFYLGSGMVLAALALRPRALAKWQHTVWNQVARLGLLFAIISAVPLPYWLYAVACLGAIGWMTTQNAKDDRWRARRETWRWTAVGVWVAMMVYEAPYHFLPRVPPLSDPALYILADSITAGLQDGEDTWPKRLARAHAIDVHDLSRAGATAGSALQQAEKVPAQGGLILLEIGGNDLLGSTTLAEFERDLDALLERLAAPGRTVLMFELPLPSLCNGYGRIQRKLAARHDVRLIPKRILMGILTGHAATVDTIHLDQAGHAAMAEQVWRIIGPAYAVSPQQ